MVAAIDWRLFALFLEAKRIVAGLTQWQLSRQAHVAPAIVWQALACRPLDAIAFSKLCAWQNEAPAIFQRRRGEHGQATE
jgi:hypothetical protein